MDVSEKMKVFAYNYIPLPLLHSISPYYNLHVKSITIHPILTKNSFNEFCQFPLKAHLKLFLTADAVATTAIQLPYNFYIFIFIPPDPHQTKNK